MNKLFQLPTCHLISNRQGTPRLEATLKCVFESDPSPVMILRLSQKYPMALEKNTASTM